MRGMEPNSVDAIVTDPPYGLEFMGKEWDKLWATRDGNHQNLPGRTTGTHPYLQAHVEKYVGGSQAQDWHYTWAVEALRVAKPGCHLLAFGGTRTFHRLACAIEDAGWEIRDTLMWVYGSGFPKGLDVSKAIDKAGGAKREVVGTYRISGLTPDRKNFGANDRSGGQGMGFRPGDIPIAAPATDAARQWQGWGTALKPAWEPIVLARKPLDGTVAQNVQKWGCGGLNINGTRIISKYLTGQRPCAILGAWEKEKDHSSLSVLLAANIVRRLAQAKKECFALNNVAQTMNEKGKITRADISKLVIGCSAGRCPVGQGDDPYEHGNLNIGGFGKKNMAQFQKDIVSIIETATRAITDWSTLNFGPSENISDSIRENTIAESKNSRLGQDNNVSAAPVGRWPSNFIHDGSDEVMELFPNTSSNSGTPFKRGGKEAGTNGYDGGWSAIDSQGFYGDSGSAARFFYCAKASRAEREIGCEGMVIRENLDLTGGDRNRENDRAGTNRNGPLKAANHHPTVKPLALMRYLCRLVTPPNGIILDPFMGSGTTGMAAKVEGFEFIGIEKEADYCEISERRIEATA
jgi:DNA modification methylase